MLKLDKIELNSKNQFYFRICTVKIDELYVALYSIASHPLNSNEFCVCGKDNFVRTYDQRKCGSGCLPLNMYFPKKVQVRLFVNDTKIDAEEN